MIFGFHSVADVTPTRLREGLTILEELVPAGYRQAVRRAQDFQGDRMGAYLDEDIAATFSDPEIQDSVRTCAFTVPLVRKVIERLSLLYKREPVRRVRALGEGQGAAPAAERLYGEIAFGGALSEVLRAALKSVNLLRLAIVGVAVSGDRLCFDLLSGRDVLLAPPPDGRAGEMQDYEAVVLPKPYRADGRRVFAFWSREFHFLFDEEGFVVEDFGDPALANPFGAIPFVRIDREPGAELYPMPLESLVAANRRLNFAITELFYTKKFQSFGQPVFVTDDEVRPDFKVGVQHLVHVIKRDAAASGDFRFESPHAPIGEVKDSVFDFLRLVARLHDVSPQSVDVSARVESGVSRALSERDALEARERDIALFRRTEDRLFEIVGAVARYHAAAGGALAARYGEALGALDPRRLGLLVDYPEVEPAIDPAERLTLQEREIALGLRNVVDVYRERNPDAAAWSADQVLAAIAANREANAAALGGLPTE